MLPSCCYSRPSPSRGALLLLLMLPSRSVALAVCRAGVWPTSKLMALTVIICYLSHIFARGRGDCGAGSGPRTAGAAAAPRLRAQPTTPTHTSNNNTHTHRSASLPALRSPYIVGLVCTVVVERQGLASVRRGHGPSPARPCPGLRLVLCWHRHERAQRRRDTRGLGPSPPSKPAPAPAPRDQHQHPHTRA